MHALLTTPLGFSALFGAAALLAGLARRSRFGRRLPARTAAALLVAAWGVVMIAACPVVATRVLRAVERAGDRWPPLPAWSAAESPDAIVILTGGQRGGDGPAPMLNEASTDRLLAGLDAARRWPDAPVVITGGASGGSRVPTARLMARRARSLGLADDRIVLEDQAADTRENATLTAPVLARLGRRRVALVTSPDHMARARGAFWRAGIETMPVPATTGTPLASGWDQLLPDGSALGNTTAALHEAIGLLVYRGRGWTGPPDGAISRSR